MPGPRAWRPARGGCGRQFGTRIEAHWQALARVVLVETRRGGVTIMGGEEMAPGRQGRRGGPVPDGQPPVTIPRGAYLALAVAAVLLGGAAVVRSTRGVATVEESDLTNFFLRSANNILAGHPFAIYAIHPPDGFPNDSPPLIMFLLAPLLALARMVGFAATTGQQITFVSIPFLLLVPALGYLTLV